MRVSLFIPWSILVSKDLKIQEVLEYHRSRFDLSHLDGWTGEAGKRKWGPSRLAKKFQYFIYLHCAIGRRYPDRVKENLSRLDRTFAAYWNPNIADDDALEAGVVSARKIREELQRRLTLIDTALLNQETAVTDN